jgi:hypothetical protein
MQKVRVTITRYIVDAKIEGEDIIYGNKRTDHRWDEDISDFLPNSPKGPIQQAVDQVIKRLKSMDYQERDIIKKQAKDPAYNGKPIPMRKWVITNVKLIQ